MKSEVLKRLEKLKAEIQDMDTSVKEDMNNKELRDEDVYRINEKIKDLEKQILNVIEG
jgi:peptidoglycan hydrolase CwlO-like protein